MANATITKTELRKTVGKGKFTVADFSEKQGVKAPTARRRLYALVEAGLVEKLPETEKVTNVKGDQRGRPRFTFRVAKGK